jgi:hypothetical protein
MIKKSLLLSTLLSSLSLFAQLELEVTLKDENNQVMLFERYPLHNTGEYAQIASENALIMIGATQEEQNVTFEVITAQVLRDVESSDDIHENDVDVKPYCEVAPVGQPVKLSLVDLGLVLELVAHTAQ